ncbi:MAG TPA: GatB/YqeY domain-containing protein [Chloroflexota bacterium]|nr:GatB/YqeY domain-containing protein [Chloroflexota bacterium]
MAHFQERLADDLKDAMRARDERRRDTIRMLTAALKNAQIAAMRPLSEAEAEAVLVGQVKQRRDSIESFRAAGREDLAAKEEAELAILAAYMPAPPTDPELSAAIQEAITATGATSLRDMAGVVRVVLERYPGRVDGKEVAARVRGALQGAV